MRGEIAKFDTIIVAKLSFQVSYSSLKCLLEKKWRHNSFRVVKKDEQFILQSMIYAPIPIMAQMGTTGLNFLMLTDDNKFTT